MFNLRLVLLDHAKRQTSNPIAMRILGDLVAQKQKYFERTDPHYIVMDKHDMIGTHFLIYDTTDIFNPKMIFAIRVTYEDRASECRLKTPLLDLMPNLNLDARRAFDSYRKSHPVLVDCNSWAVDPEFSKKKSGLNLSDIGYAMVYFHLMRMGHDHFVGCCNEKYKASRWIERAGQFPKNFIFTHPAVPDPHMLIMMQSFNHKHMKAIYFENKELFDSIVEAVPENPRYASFLETFNAMYIQDSILPKAG